MGQQLKSGQVYDFLAQKIASGELAPGDRIAPEKELAAQLGIGRCTLRTALARLEDDRLIVRLRQQGTFVAGGIRKSGCSTLPRLPEPPRYRRNLKHKLLVLYREGAIDSSAGMVRQIAAYAAVKKVETVEVSINFLESGSREKRLAWLREQYFSGAIIPIHGIGTDSPLLDLPGALHVPVVLPFAMDSDCTFQEFFTLRSLTRSAVFRSILYLYRKGHRKIGVIMQKFPERLHLPPHLHDVSPHELNFICMEGKPVFASAAEKRESVCAAVDELLKQEPGLTAVFCYNDFMAATALEHLQSLGKDVPGDVSVMGYAANPAGGMVNPPLTSISLFMEERVRKSVDFLLAGDYRQEIFLPPEPAIIERESVRDIKTETEKAVRQDEK